MGNPLIIATLLLAGVSIAGLVIDARATRRRATRAFGVSALAIKIVLTVGFVLQMLHVRTFPMSLYHEFGGYVTFFALVTVAVPLVAMTVACECAAIEWIHRNERSLPNKAPAKDSVAVHDR